MVKDAGLASANLSNDMCGILAWAAEQVVRDPSLERVESAIMGAITGIQELIGIEKVILAITGTIAGIQELVKKKLYWPSRVLSQVCKELSSS